MATRVLSMVNYGTGPAEDRRRSIRRPTPLTGKLTGGSAPTELKVADLSDHGIGFLTTTPVEIGTDRQVILARPGTFNLRAQIRVVSCRGQDDGQYLVGAEFVL